MGGGGLFATTQTSTVHIVHEYRRRFIKTASPLERVHESVNLGAGNGIGIGAVRVEENYQVSEV